MRLTPVPSLSRLAELVDTVRDAGLAVTCHVSGPVAELPPGVDLTAYRIVQEALTNALRHAPGAAASVRVACAPGEVTVEVSNAGPAAGLPRRRPRRLAAARLLAPARPVPPGPATAWRASPSASRPAAARWRSARRPTAASRSRPGCR